MAQKYQSFPGMEDILPGEIEKWQWLEEKARAFFESRGFREIRTPLLEPTELFSRAIGETTDIVHKEMYTLEDRGGRSMTLRPEMTAAVGRAVIQNSLLRNVDSLSLYYIGPMFRAERPQAGRKRQFHQIGAEIIQEAGVDADIRLIESIYGFLKYLKLESPKIRINDLSLINGKDSEKVRGKLREYFEAHKKDLDKDSLYRLDKNVLRIFDSKEAKTAAIADKCPWDKIAPLSDGFRQVTDELDARNIPYEVNRRLVRGLDYYTGVVFEVALPGLGAQDAVAGGGRYDRLYEELGGGKVPCTGHSIGMERLLMALAVNKPSLETQMKETSLYFAPVVDKGDAGAADVLQRAADILLRLRGLGFRVQCGKLSAKMGDHFKRADKSGAGSVIIVGPDELKNNQYTLKNLETKEQATLNLEALIGKLTLKKAGI